jgi:hypothetical protein
MTQSTSQSTQSVYPEPEEFPELYPEFLPEPVPEEDDYGTEVVNSGESTVILPASELPDYTPHVEHSYQAKSFKCVRCGSTNLARGFVVDYGDKFEQVRFSPKRVNIQWLNSLFNLRPWKRLIKLEADACRDCGAVLLVINPDELRRAEYKRD